MNWRSLLTRQSPTWSEKTKPDYATHRGDIREYVKAWDKANHYVMPSYAWDTGTNASSGQSA